MGGPESMIFSFFRHLILFFVLYSNHRSDDCINTLHILFSFTSMPKGRILLKNNSVMCTIQKMRVRVWRGNNLLHGYVCFSEQFKSWKDEENSLDCGNFVCLGFFLFAWFGFCGNRPFGEVFTSVLEISCFGLFALFPIWTGQLSHFSL